MAPSLIIFKEEESYNAQCHDCSKVTERKYGVYFMTLLSRGYVVYTVLIMV